MRYLMVKTHNQTGLRYLCSRHIDTREQAIAYLGSGTFWKRHLKMHGQNISTRILLETNNKQELFERGLYYSNLWNVFGKKPNGWANLAPETGQGGPMFLGKRHSDGSKRKISIKLLGRKLTAEWKQKIGLAHKGRKISKEAREKMSATHKVINKGVGNTNWKGYWITPVGKFAMVKDASAQTKISTMTIPLLCKRLNKIPISNHVIKNNKFLKRIGAIKGQTPKELGFGFEEVKRH